MIGKNNKFTRVAALIALAGMMGATAPAMAEGWGGHGGGGYGYHGGYGGGHGPRGGYDGHGYARGYGRGYGGGYGGYYGGYWAPAGYGYYAPAAYYDEDAYPLAYPVPVYVPSITIGIPIR